MDHRPASYGELHRLRVLTRHGEVARFRTGVPSAPPRHPQHAATLVGVAGVVTLDLEDASATAMLRGVLTSSEAIVSLVEGVTALAVDPLHVRGGV